MVELKPYTIGPYQFSNNLALAPMAGVTDRPFRQLCRELGAGLVVSEMINPDPSLIGTRKSQWRMNFDHEPGPRIVQIVGSDPQAMAEGARFNVELGAQIIDINMGCPAKKVCKKAAGSALLADEKLVGEILDAVVAAVDVPVTLKIRTGTNPDLRNGVNIARIAQSAGIQSLAVHGRTRQDLYKGEAEYDTIAAIRESIDIPLLANGDITSAEKARMVLEKTGADGIMIGRGAQGNPWIFREIAHYLTHQQLLPPPSAEEIRTVLLGHVQNLHDFYGDVMGVRIARKHIGWYLDAHNMNSETRQHLNQIQLPDEQLTALDRVVDLLSAQEAA